MSSEFSCLRMLSGWLAVGQAQHSAPARVQTCAACVQAFEKASGKKVEHKLVDRRPGDTVAVYAATETAEKELGWKTKLDVNDMCRDQWAWASKHPKGFEQ